jgi:YbbR domain-containing protein
MMDKFKNNTKIKLISLLSALLLWLYVMAVVDPEETKLFEEVPIVISNMDDLKEKNLVIYPDIELTTDISISGKLSNIQKIKKENIHVYGQINNPIEGKNDIYLKANTSERVTHEFKNNIIIVNLEKVVSEERSIEIQAEGKSKENIDTVSIDKGQSSIDISGPRVLVNQVQKIIGILDVGSKTNDFSTQISLTPIDEDGNEVEGVELQQTSVIVSATLLKEKDVPIKIKFAEQSNSETNLKDYTLSKDSISVKGKREIIDKLEYIETQVVNIKDITKNASKDIYLNIPEGVTTETDYISIKLNNLEVIKEEFVYIPEEVEIRNNENNIDLTTIKVPEKINVNIEYLESMGTITKSDIVLYIDLAQPISQGAKYDIKYDIKYDLKNIVIDSNKTE